MIMIIVFRFSDALEFLKVGVDMPKKLKGWNEVRWPQSEEVIEESKLNVFKVNAVTSLK